MELPILNFPKQQEIFDSQAKYTIVVKGRRFGLTKGAANDFIESALEGKFKKGLWVDVINPNIDKYIERYFIPHLNRLPRNIWSWRKQAKIITIKDSYIDFRSADHPEALEGFGYDKAFLNEAGVILKDEYLWENAIRPMFWDYPNVRVVIGGTPKGKGKFYELYQRGQDEEQTIYKSLHFTSFDSPFDHIHKAIREDMASMPQRVIEQEIMARFLEDTGVVFRGFMEVMDATPQKPQRDARYVIGCDLAKVEDFTVLAVYNAKTNKQVYQARFNQIDWGMQKARIAETARHYQDKDGNPATVVIDATGLGEPVVEDLARMGVPVDPIRFTNEQKRQLIEKLVTWVETGRVHMLPLEETKREFENFTYDISEQTGRVRYNAPVGFHDDVVIAHALAVWRLIIKEKQLQVKKKTLLRLSYEKKLKEQEGEIYQDIWGY